MSVAFYVDEHIHGAITDGLRQRGVDVLTVQADGWDGRDDPEVLDRAGTSGRTLVTNDEDFLEEASRRQQQGEQFAGNIYAPQQRLTIGRCIDDLELISGVYEPAELQDLVIWLPVT